MFSLCHHSPQPWQSGSPSFRYELEYQRSDGTPFYGIKVLGSYVELNRETCYRFSRDQYELVNLVEESNRESQQIKNRGELSQYNTLQLARIKRERKKSTPPWTGSWNGRKSLQRINFLCDWKKSGRILSVLPVLLRKDGDSYTRMEADSLEQGFRSNPYNTGKIYGPDKTQYVFTPEQEEGIRRCAGVSGCLRRRPGR